MAKQGIAPPDWVATMRPGAWYRLSGDRPDLGLPPTAPGTRYLIDNDPARDQRLNPPRSPKERLRRAFGRAPQSPWHGRVGFPAITEAWNGAVYAAGVGTCGAMIVFGGGHNNYFGSDVHAFDLGRRIWMRLDDGYVSGRADEYGACAAYPSTTYADGSPLPPHTYGYVQYDPAGNDVIIAKGAVLLGPDPQSAPIPHLFNLDRRRWRHGPRHPSVRLDSGGFSAFDARRRLLWVHGGDDAGGNGLTAYAPDGSNADGTFGHWEPRYDSKLPGVANHAAMQIDPAHDNLVFVCHADDRLALLDPQRPQAPLKPVASSGKRPRLAPFAGFEYGANLGALIYCSAVDAGRTYRIDGGFRWHRLDSDAGLDPVADAAAHSRFAVNRSHTFGRFRVASFVGVDVAIWIRHVDSPVYAMRLGSCRRE